jgi:hypothetical protein
MQRKLFKQHRFPNPRHWTTKLDKKAIENYGGSQGAEATLRTRTTETPSGKGIVRL